MNMPIKFDTLEFTTTLMASGISEDQATALAQALSEALQQGTITPAELLLLKTELNARMEMLRTELGAWGDKLRAELEARIDRLKTELEARISTLKTELLARIDMLKVQMDAKFTILIFLSGLSLALHAAAIGALIYIIGRLP